MATMKDRITPKQKPQSSQAGIQMQVTPPSVKIGSPNISIPEIKIPEINIPAADMKPISDAFNALSQSMQMLAQQQNAILQNMAETSKLIAELAKKESKVEVAAPQIKMPQRPNEFYVEIDNEDGEAVGMRITSNSRRN